MTTGEVKWPEGLVRGPVHVHETGEQVVTISDEAVLRSMLDAARARAEKAEKERDEERRQRIHEQGIARDAIALVRRFAEQAIPTLDECTCPVRAGGVCDTCERREAMAAARAFLDGVKV